MLQNSDRFHWVAIYSDGTQLLQVEPDGKKNTYSDIDREKLVAFEMWENVPRRMILSLRFKKGQRLIWRRRVEMEGGLVSEVCHILGKQETVNGKNYQGIIGLFESDGRIEVTGKFEEGHPWFFPIKVHEKEKEEWIDEDSKLN